MWQAHTMTDHTGKAAGTGFTRDDSDKTTGRSKKGVRSVTGVLKWVKEPSTVGESCKFEVRDSASKGAMQIPRCHARISINC